MAETEGNGAVVKSVAGEVTPIRPGSTMEVNDEDDEEDKDDVIMVSPSTGGA